MKITKKILVEMIEKEIKSTKKLDERYERLINEFSKSLLTESTEKTKLAASNMQSLKREAEKFGRLLSDEERNLRNKVEFQMRPADMEGLLEEAEKQASIAMQQIIIKFLERARQLKLENPEIFAALLVDTTMKGAVEFVKHQDNMMKILKKAQQFEKELEEPKTSAKPSAPPAPPED